MRILAVGLLAVTALGLGLSLGAAGCISNATLTCETTACSTGSRSYQLCDTVGGSITYKLGSASCSFSGANEAQAETCEAEVESYCATGVASAGDGGISGIGTNGADASSSPCTYTVTGAQTASGSCSVNAAYDSQKGGLGFTVTAGDTMNFGATLTGETALVDGTYSLANAAPGAGGEFLESVTTAYTMCTTAANCSDAKGNQSSPQGSFTLVVTNPGPATQGLLWSSPQGTVTMTLPAQPGGPATGTVTVTVTL